MDPLLVLLLMAAVAAAAWFYYGRRQPPPEEDEWTLPPVAGPATAPPRSRGEVFDRSSLVGGRPSTPATPTPAIPTPEPADTFDRSSLVNRDRTLDVSAWDDSTDASDDDGANG